MTEKRNLLVAVDGSKKSYDAFLEALKYSEAQITLLYVIDQSLPNDQEFYLSPQYQILPENNAFEPFAENYLNRLASSAGVEHNIQKVTMEGNASKCIVQYAEENPIDLIILGKTGKGTVERMILGSTSHYVLKHASCNVLVVN
ncbi:universal stress protein [Listeria sp. PSOL-1]|uniref:universal stress protein n=1 Tax=Listeria sp. PSOL-1 TaxID=1844999 RepID=UPI0013D63644|nr:universal stress protein [Listeria sp. PSOL-1]